MAAKKLYINGKEINAKLITDLTALTAVEVTDTTKKSIPVADEDSPNDEAKKMTLSELSNILTYGYGVKVYEALLTQTGTNAPVATVLKNTLGGTPTWGYSSAGRYTLTLLNTFTVGKTCINFGICNTVGNPKIIQLYDDEGITDDILEFEFKDLSGESKNEFSNILIEIKIYP
jgi:hypothetical protein